MPPSMPPGTHPLCLHIANREPPSMPSSATQYATQSATQSSDRTLGTGTEVKPKITADLETDLLQGLPCLSPGIPAGSPAKTFRDDDQDQLQVPIDSVPTSNERRAGILNRMFVLHPPQCSWSPRAYFSCNPSDTFPGESVDLVGPWYPMPNCGCAAALNFLSFLSPRDLKSCLVYT